jgi:hypothetical protein
MGAQDVQSQDELIGDIGDENQRARTQMYKIQAGNGQCPA